MVTLDCTYCGKSFERSNKEFNRQQVKLGLKPYCGIGHAVAERNKRLRKGNPENLQIKYLDDYSPFRKFVGSAKCRKKGCDITPEYLKALWDEQGGLCPFTGMKMELRVWYREGDRVATPRQASLDRIDDAKGYMVGNVRFISAMANLARHRWSDEQVIEFCRDVAAFKSNRLS
jgi:hypothetical protein